MRSPFERAAYALSMLAAALRFCSSGPRPIWALCAAALLALSLAACATTDYDAGMKANDMGLYRLAARDFNSGAKAGDPRSEFMLGYYWANGVLGKKWQNWGLACSWYKKAADQGLPAAINNLGACYECPCIVQHDVNRAIDLYTLAARKGEPHAQSNLVRLGRPVPPIDLAPPPKPVVRQQQVAEKPPPSRQSESDESSGSVLAAVALFLTGAAAGYSAAQPQPRYFAPPVSVHCTTTSFGQMASTNCN